MVPDNYETLTRDELIAALRIREMQDGERRERDMRMQRLLDGINDPNTTLQVYDQMITDAEMALETEISCDWWKALLRPRYMRTRWMIKARVIQELRKERLAKLYLADMKVQLGL
jgi:hypothetical protein